MPFILFLSDFYIEGDSFLIWCDKSVLGLKFNYCLLYLRIIVKFSSLFIAFRIKMFNFVVLILLFMHFYGQEFCYTGGSGR